MNKKTAVVLFNLGGPDSPAAVKPFLFNLFNDPAIIRLPSPLRQFVAWAISSRRDKTAQEIYGKIGGRSPILENTRAQAIALEKSLADVGLVKTFVAMRYWHPFTEQTLNNVISFAPDEIILLPLYPQFSTTTTGSSLALWNKLADRSGLDVPARVICCYPDNDGFIQSLSSSTKRAFETAKTHGKPRILFSAHGLPEKIVSAGDPYQWQCEQTTRALVDTLKIDGLDYTLCYQSRVGPLKWIGPSTDDEIRRAGRDGVPLVIVPIAFVSEHSETLVEIDMEYRHLAKECGVPGYTYVPTVGIDDGFIRGLADLVKQFLSGTPGCRSGNGGRLCPAEFTGCCQHEVRA